MRTWPGGFLVEDFGPRGLQGDLDVVVAVRGMTTLAITCTASTPWGGRSTDVPVDAHSRHLLDDRRPGGPDILYGGKKT
ncbi:MAG: hypothetical protein IH878_19135 [Gemmatimonadetes bacterium]|nr:hypothetical protein [Gemmatimonadota bacterium]